ncbi:2-isopropylmalate synthase [Geosporobacter subterraneus DSM 17957]|uniref:Citramalate synthase n=1 Tax=Geosporobacter subterraneus DSM 17957 TaxID=1121919 RepID=A0A1M6JPG0_9FIRM|nr:citramalate synthase [Geosporobacter subterraneus]SHJ48601.1 2-isopropylmalate synthase [Geosporobacter subterraneus DSM 17957]
MKKIAIYDTTLRDGAQAEGISFSVKDKIKIVEKLDALGVDYIEAGNPGSNPKDLEFFKSIAPMELKHSKLAAFGSTRRTNKPVEEDANIQALLRANTPVVAIFGKSWDFHVTEIIHTTLQENLNMIQDTLQYLKDKGKEVIYDAEHFFDGYKHNPDYAVETLRAAAAGGASWLVLCDTNGGTLPLEIKEITRKIVKEFQVPIGIHCHNDTGMAVANSFIAIQEGARQLQGTLNGYGERCGNANLCVLIPNLQLKADYYCIEDKKLKELTGISRWVSELANMAHDEKMPYVGNSAFAHKGGMHIDAVHKNPLSFEHIPPEVVGNERRVLMSEVAGRSTILSKIRGIDGRIHKESPETKEIIERLKSLENEGYQFEGAESSVELMIRRKIGAHKRFFEIKDFRVLSEKPWKDDNSATAMIKVAVGDQEAVTAAEGNGPVNALDKAIRKALEVFYPQLKNNRLTDYKVRVLDTNAATGAKVRVHIESTDGENVWGTVGVSTDIIEASFEALVDSIEYFLFREMEQEE